MSEEFEGGGQELGTSPEDIGHLWASLECVLGDGLARLIFERALEVSALESPSLEALEVSSSGVSLVEGASPAQPEALKALADAVVEMVQLLVGRALAPDLPALLEWSK